MTFTRGAALILLIVAGGSDARAESCAKAPRNLELSINYTERLMGRNQRLSARFSKGGELTVKNLVTGDSRKLSPKECAQWRSDAGAILDAALAHVRRAPAAQEQNLVCDRVAVVSGGGKTSRVCLSAIQPTVRGRAFRDLYESFETLLVLR